MAKLALSIVSACLATVALAGGTAAQTPASPPGAIPAQDASPPPADRQHAIVGGKRIQPRPEGSQPEQDPEAQLRLLQKERRDLPPNEPLVVPRDIYGNPLGGNPGLDPPGLTPTQRQGQSPPSGPTPKP